MMNKRKQKGSRAYRFGWWAEQAALLFLRMKGYRILATRVRNFAGEVDIIARKGVSCGKMLVFIEVKARTVKNTGDEMLIGAISLTQQQRIMQAALVFMQQNPAYTVYDMRFDAVFIRPYRLPLHYKNAWEAAY